MTEKLGARMTGPQLRAVRERLGIRADRLADLLGVRADTVSKWERGKDPIPYRLRHELIAVIEARIPEMQELITELGEQNPHNEGGPK